LPSASTRCCRSTTALCSAATIPHLTARHCIAALQRHGISQLPQVEGEASAKRKFKTYRSATGLASKSGEFPVSDEELDDTATTVYEGI